MEVDAFEDTPHRENKPSVAEVLASCKGCNGKGLALETSREGHVLAKKCGCLDGSRFSGDDWQRHQALEEKAGQISAAEIPNRFFKALTSPCQRPDLDEWIKSIRDEKCHVPMAFFFGDTGTGKTHAAAGVLLNLMVRDEGCFGLYVPLYTLINNRQAHLETRYDRDEGEKQRNRRVHSWYVNRAKQVDILVLDEMGQEKLSYDERKFVFALLDQRYSAGKITILCSNHCKNLDLSLEKKNLASMVGKRISSRIEAAKYFHFKGPDRRLQEGSVSISDEEIKSFKVPAKILTHDEDTHQIMTWLTRNPIFESISVQRRRELTEVVSGEEKDSDRPSITTYKNVWVHGDRLSISGPICDHGDRRLYAFLLKELASNHAAMQSGLKITISYRQILQGLGVSVSGQSVTQIRRHLNRLNRMSLEFKSANGNRWSGALLFGVTEIGQGVANRIEITFSPFMIAFYRAHAYTTFNRKLSEKLMGDGSAFYLFFSSHDRNRPLYPMSFEQCRNLLAISDTTSEKASLRRISRAVKDLIEFNILSKNTWLKNRILQPFAGPAL